jgi:hypothetical protein
LYAESPTNNFLQSCAGIFRFQFRQLSAQKWGTRPGALDPTFSIYPCRRYLVSAGSFDHPGLGFQQYKEYNVGSYGTQASYSANALRVPKEFKHTQHACWHENLGEINFHNPNSIHQIAIVIQVAQVAPYLFALVFPSSPNDLLHCR